MSLSCEWVICNCLHHSPRSAPPKIFSSFWLCIALVVYCLSDSNMGMYYFPNPCNGEKFCYSPYYTWGIKAVLCFYWLWNLCLNSKSQMAWAMSVWPGGAGAQVRASPALHFRFLFWWGTLDFPYENQSDNQCTDSPQGTLTMSWSNKTV